VVLEEEVRREVAYIACDAAACCEASEDVGDGWEGLGGIGHGQLRRGLCGGLLEVGVP